MRILVAPTAFKGSYSPVEVAKAMSEGISEYSRLAGIDVEVVQLPLADGGDGTIEALAASSGELLQTLEVAGSLGEPRTACWLDLGSYAVVEMASACGIAGLAKADLRPLVANSLGLGTVLRHVIESSDITNIVIALGGSASTDGGSGALYELGARFFDAQGRQFVPAGGGSLGQLARCDLSPAKLNLRGRRLHVATDVTNPLLGEDGAANVFGPQKGASREEIALLDQALSHYADLVEADGGVRLRFLKGAGSAGGTAFGLAALGATVTQGFDWLSDLLSLPERIARSDLILTGEGRTDLSSLQGKVVGSLFDLCTKYGKPLWVFSGTTAAELEKSSLRPAVMRSLAAPDQQADAAEIRQAVLFELSRRFGHQD